MAFADEEPTPRLEQVSDDLSPLGHIGKPAQRSDPGEHETIQVDDGEVELDRQGLIQIETGRRAHRQPAVSHVSHQIGKQVVLGADAERLLGPLLDLQ